MSIYSRSYMRPEDSYESKPWAIKSLLIALFALFIIQNIVRHWFGSGFFEEYMSLSIRNLLSGLIYTPLSYSLIHSVEGAIPWHFVFNALFIWWFGKLVETKYGSVKFLELFFFSAIFGGLFWLGFRFTLGADGYLVGASAGAYGIFFLFCRFYWDQSLNFLFIPFQLNGKTIFYVIAGFQLFFFMFSELPAQGQPTAYSAHLGGMVGAYFFERFLLYRPSLASWFEKKKPVEILKPNTTASTASSASKSKSKFGYKVNVRDSRAMKKEVDRILDKINEKGFGSLSNDEKKILDQAKNKL